MRFRASNLYVLAGIVIAIAAVVLFSDRAQRNAADDSSSEQGANAAMIQAGLDYVKASELYIAGGDRMQLLRWDTARQQLEQAIAGLNQVVESEPEELDLFQEQVSGIRQLELLTGLAVERRNLGDNPGTTEQLQRRLETFDQVVRANAELAEMIEDERREAQSSTGRITLIAVALLGALIMALGFAARRDDRRRRRDNLFSESLQSARTEAEAYTLVRDHLQREVRESEVAVLNRNNSANRLEPTTPLDSSSALAEALEGAKPDDCLAIRSAKPSKGGTGRDDLLRCEICGMEKGKNALCVPSVVGGEVIGSVLIRRGKGFDEATERTVTQAVSEAAPSVAHLRNLALAERRAASDNLTGLANKRSAGDTLQRMVANARRTNSNLALVSLDLDHFKRVNDTYGHPKGDEVLAAVGSAISGAIRDNDFAGRDGGEEFMILLPGSDAEGGRKVAEKLREAIAELHVAGVSPGVTASCGVACLPDDADNREELVRKADRALYAAKRAGRNRVFLAAEQTEGAHTEHAGNGNGADSSGLPRGSTTTPAG